MICFGLVVPGAVGAAADGRATLPYSKLELIFDKKAMLERRGVLGLTTVSSRNPAVRLADISMSIQSKVAGTIPVPLGSEGELSRLPRTEALRKENPPVVFNQPKGTLRLNVALGLPVPAANTFPYRQLADGLAEGNRAIKEQAGMFSFWAPQLKGMVFRFSKNRGDDDNSALRTLTVTRKDGQKMIFTADAKQQLVLIIEPVLAEQNAQVTVSERPESILLRLPSGETSW